MSESSSSFFSSFSLLRGQRLDDFEPFMEMLPLPGLLLDARDGRILLANTPFANLVAYSRAELNGMHLAAFFPDDSLEALAQAAREPATFDLHRRGAAQLAVQVMQATHSQNGRRILLVLQAADVHARPFDQPWLAQFWQNIQALAAAAQADDLLGATEGVLQAGAGLSGATCLAVYRLAADQPALLRFASYGAPDVLPEQLPAQDLAQLSRSRLWQSGKRAATPLQRAARAASLAFLAVAPLGQPRAITGLLALGGPRPAPGDLPTRAADLLAAQLTALSQSQSRIESLQATLTTHDYQQVSGEALEQGSRQGILRLDPGLRIRRLNLAAESMLGYVAPRVVGQPVEAILIGAEALPLALQDALDGSPTYNLGDVRLYRRSGEAFPARLRILPVLHGEKVVEIIVFVDDLSEMENIRQQSLQLENRALLGEVTAVFAHEVRNPINNISTGLQLMAMNLPAEDPNQAAVARMLQDCDRLAELMKSVLAFSRTAEYDMERLDLGLLLRRLLERQRPRLSRPELSIDVQIEADCPAVNGNLRALEQVFANLIGNAVQAMGEKGGSLILRAAPLERDGRRFLEASVADTGPGIPKEEQDKVFQPFFTTQRDGTGLGLAIAKRIITAHKGSIRLNSFPGGTIFYIQLPAAGE